MVTNPEDFDANASTPVSGDPEDVFAAEIERQLSEIRKRAAAPDETHEEPVPVASETVEASHVSPVVEEAAEAHESEEIQPEHSAIVEAPQVAPITQELSPAAPVAHVAAVEVPEIELPAGFTMVEPVGARGEGATAEEAPVKRERSRRASRSRGPQRGKSRPSSQPVSRKRRSAQVLSYTAMGFVAAIAIATSVPANALLSPEDVALLAEAQNIDTWNTDSQSVDVTGTGEPSVSRDGVSVSSQAVIAAGDFLNRVAVSVPESSNPIVWPFTVVQVSSKFGWRGAIGWGSASGADNFHTGLDMAPAYGTPINSVADGIVTLTSGAGGPIGVTVMIEHNVKGNKFASVYGHMAPGSVTVQTGQSVKAGDVIGAVGNTGYSTGPHLHLEIRPGSQPVDPFAFLMQYAGQPKELKYDPGVQ